MKNSDGNIEIPITDPEHLKKVILTADVTSSAGSSYGGAGCALCMNVDTGDGLRFWTSKSFTLNLGNDKTATVDFDGTFGNDDELMKAVICDDKIEIQKWWDYSEKQEQDIDDIVSVKFKNIQVIYESTNGEMSTVRGDVNNDGVFNVSDVVLLQKWLLSVKDKKIVNWKAGNLNEDNRIDVFDLVLMRKELVKQNIKK